MLTFPTMCAPANIPAISDRAAEGTWAADTWADGGPYVAGGAAGAGMYVAGGAHGGAHGGGDGGGDGGAHTAS